MKDFLVQNLVSILSVGCTIHTGAAAFFASWLRSKPSRQEIDNRFQAVNSAIEGLKKEQARTNDLHYQTAIELGRIASLLKSFKESSEKEDENLKELIKTLR